MKAFSVKKLMEGDHKGKYGVFDGDELSGLADVEPDNEGELLAGLVGKSGKIDKKRMDDMLDSGRLKPSAIRRALDSEDRSQAALQAGRIHPGHLPTATKLVLIFPEAFDAFIGDAKPGETAETKTEAAESVARICLSDLISKRMRDTGENHDCAELKIIRTDEGRKLYDRVRNEQMEYLGGSQCSERAQIESGGSEARTRLHELIEKRMREHGETAGVAEIKVVRTAQGAELWERVRKEELTADSGVYRR